jgi:hypothetical protein
MLEKFWEYLCRGGPLKIPFGELANPGDIREQLAVDGRKGLSTRKGGEWAKVGIDHFRIGEGVRDVLSAGWVPSANKVLGISAQDLTKPFTPSCQIITEISRVHGCSGMA